MSRDEQAHALAKVERFTNLIAEGKTGTVDQLPYVYFGGVCVLRSAPSQGWLMLFMQLL